MIQKCTHVTLYTWVYESHAVRNNNKLLSIVAEVLRVKKSDLRWLACCESWQIVERIRDCVDSSVQCHYEEVYRSKAGLCHKVQSGKCEKGAARRRRFSMSKG